MMHWLPGTCRAARCKRDCINFAADSGKIDCFLEEPFVFSDQPQHVISHITIKAQHKGGTMAAGKKRTTHRSSKGTKLYAVRDAKGRFVDIQTYKRAHGADIRKKSKGEK
jgi:hypothetical protein